jgi:fructose-bisphosphate aldolase / 2-amino-3,7-dideoxy-D-threo-hept-6-ulosonate synthase
MSTGKIRRLSRIFDKKSGNTIIAPLDDSLLSGPEMGLLNLKDKLTKIISAEPNAVLGFRGLFTNYSDILSDKSEILNLSASSIRSNYTRKVIIGRVEEALSLGVDAVAVHVNITSAYEHEMLGHLGRITRECEIYGLPVVAIMYPRTESQEADPRPHYEYDDLKLSNLNKYTALVAHCARIGVELGVDIIKTQYTGTRESFEKVVKAAYPVPVVCAGGPPIDVLSVLSNAENIILAGGRGLSFARNIFCRRDPSLLIQTLREIVHNRSNVEDAIKLTGFIPNHENNQIEN